MTEEDIEEDSAEEELDFLNKEVERIGEFIHSN